MIGIAPEGAKITFGLAALGLLLFAVVSHAAGDLTFLSAFAAAMFFRDPDRFPERTDGVVISGADGRVTEISEGALPEGGATVCHRVAVFMSPLNVHVNRAPVGGEVTLVEHTPGKFRAAFRDEAGEHNERNLMVFRDAAGRRHGMVQIAGYLARRIVCRLRAHDKVVAGQRVGLIMFGSRVDHLIPPDYRVTVAVGERVRAGITVLGELSR